MRLAHGLDDRRATRTVNPRAFRRKPLSRTIWRQFRPLEKLHLGTDGTGFGAAEGQELAGSTVTLKLKTTDFRIRTRAHSSKRPTTRVTGYSPPARDLLEREADGTRYRLLGVGVTGLTDTEIADPADLVDQKGQRSVAAEHAVDRLRKRFGDDAVVKGLTFGED